MAHALRIRPLELCDLPAALAIQAACYPPFLRENEPAFASRLTVASPYCYAATGDAGLVAYLLGHGWPAASPPPVGTVLPGDVRGEVLFLHDLAVAPAGRGSGIGAELVAHALRSAAADGFAEAELIAVEGAAAYWRRLGFAETAVTPALAAKLAGYGAAARWMRRGIAAG